MQTGSLSSRRRAVKQCTVLSPYMANMKLFVVLLATLLCGVAMAEQVVETLPLEDQGEPDMESYDEVVADEPSTPEDIDDPEQPQQADEPAESPLVVIKQTAPEVDSDEVIDPYQEAAEIASDEVIDVDQEAPEVASDEDIDVDQEVDDSPKKCKVIADVAFILDSSGSITNDYQNEKNFLKALAGAFGLSKKGSQAGVITFSYYTEISIKLNQYHDIKSFNKAVDKIPLMGYTTRIDRALRQAQKEFFTAANGGRKKVPKIIILLTDGTQSQDDDAEDPAKVAKEVRGAGIATIVVGIGSGTDPKELEKISGSKENAFTAKSFDELLKGPFIKKLQDKSCEAAKETPDTIKIPGCPDRGFMYPGDDLGIQITTDSWEACGQKCNEEPKCKFFTYTISKKRCSLKTTIKKRSSNKNKVSGAKGCPKTTDLSGATWITWFSRMAGSWRIEWGGGVVVNIRITWSGLVFIGKSKFSLMLSDKSRFSSALGGWFRFKFGSWWYYLRLTVKGLQVMRFGTAGKLTFEGIAHFGGMGFGIKMAGAGTYLLLRGMTLPVGAALHSADGRFKCVMQLDGNFVLYGPNGKAFWHTKTYRNKIRGGLNFQMDGNLVLYKIGGGALWSSKTNGKGGVKLMLGNNGNLDLLNAAGKIIWSTRTSGKFPAINFHIWAKWFSKLAGSWKITWGSGKIVGLTISAGGSISIPGINYQLHLLPSNWKQFPAAHGWFRYRFMSWWFFINLSSKGLSVYRFSILPSASCSNTFKGLKNFCGTGLGVVIGGQGSANWAMWFKNMIGTWNVKLGGKPIKIVIGAGGVINIGGLKIHLMHSTFVKLPSSQGWFTFKWHSWNCYLKVGIHGIQVQWWLGGKLVGKASASAAIGVPGHINWGAWFKGLAGNWNLPWGKSTLKFTISPLGVVSIGKFRINLMLSDKLQFPSLAGWFRFKFSGWWYYLRMTIRGLQIHRFSIKPNAACKKTFLGIINFCGTGIGLPSGKLGLAWGMWFKQLAGNWNFKFPGLDLKFKICACGQITINGLKFDLMLSDRIQFPSFLGWFRFKFGSWWYYLRLTFHGLEVHRFDLNGKFGGKAIGLKFALPGIKLPGFWWSMWFKQMTGNWNLKFPGLNLKIAFTVNGGLTINGKKVFLMFSDKIQFPGFLGWFRFQFGGFWYYLRITIRGLEVQRFSINGSCKKSFLGLFNWCGNGLALKAGKGGLAWTVWFKTMAGTWNLKLPGIALKLAIAANGQLTIGGVKIWLMLSDKLQFPSFFGWFRFQFKGFWYYIRVTLKGLEGFRFSIGGHCRSTYLGIPFFCGSGHGLKIGAAMGWLKWLVKLAGSWVFNFGASLKLNIGISANGMFMINGKGVMLMLSDRFEFPAFLGFFKFTYQHWVIYFRFRLLGGLEIHRFSTDGSCKGTWRGLFFTHLPNYCGVGKSTKPGTGGHHSTCALSYTCVAGKQQSGHDILYRNHMYTRDSCADLCCKTSGCISFDYDQFWKQCWLSKTSWASVPLTAGLFNLPLLNRWSCQKKGSNGPACPKFRCIDGRVQQGHDIAHYKEGNEGGCSARCCHHKGCIGYDYNTFTKDCWLSSTTWSRVRPTGGLFNLPIPFMKTCQSTAVHDEEEIPEEEYPEDFAPQEDMTEEQQGEDEEEDDEEEEHEDEVPAEFQNKDQQDEEENDEQDEEEE